MLQRYTVRLGDGTILKVDPDGLNAWLEDGRASVQIAGTQEWRPLQDFLAEQRSAARLAQALVPPAPRPAPAPSPPETPPRPPVERSIGAPPSVQALAEEPTALVPPWRQSPEPDEEVPIRLKPLENEALAPRVAPRAAEYDDGEDLEEDAPRPDRLEGPLLQMISAFGTLLSRCLDPLTPLVKGSPPASADGRRLEPLVPPKQAAPKGPQAPAPRPPLAAPVPISELPALRFADTHEPREAEEVYGGEEGHRLLPAVWLWTRRVLLAGALLAGGVLAALRWETWFPRAAELGQTVFTGIDQQVRSGQRAEEQQEALRAATERLPHLTPETIGLVLARASGALAPPEVFQVAREAADRGVHALTPADAAELEALQRELLDHLRPPERARLAEYDRARSSRVVFPFENPHALDLVARGARSMPAPSRERLRTLLGQAVAAGLRDPP